jgi:hypothetical protein
VVDGAGNVSSLRAVLHGGTMRLEDGHTWQLRQRSSRLQLVVGGVVARSVDGGRRVRAAEWSRREGATREMAFGFTLQREAIRTALKAHVVGARSHGQKGGMVGNHGRQRLEPSGDESRRRHDRCWDGAQRNSAGGGQVGSCPGGPQAQTK